MAKQKMVSMFTSQANQINQICEENRDVLVEDVECQVRIGSKPQSRALFQACACGGWEVAL